MSAAASLVTQASAVLDAVTAHSNRAACWIARAALEAAVDDLLDVRRSGAPAASMRSKLTVLQVAYAQDDDIPRRAGYGWSRLSQACHQHAFELAPTATEARHLIELVAALVEDSARAANEYALT